MRFLRIIFIATCIFPSILFAKEVNIKDAKNVAKNFFYKHAQNNDSKDYKSLDFSLEHIENNGNNLFYVFKLNNQKGFVITSAQNFTKPILAYSDKNNIDFENLSPQARYILNGYKKQIEYGIKNNIKASRKVSSLWKNLRIPTLNKSSVTNPLGPLLLTNWDQYPYYNDMCPTNNMGEHAVSGCVAVAMAQIMKYYNFPKQGTGSHTHYDNYGDVTHYSKINYSEQTYNWSAMPRMLEGPNDELAKLMYHCGQSIDMNWGVNGSGANMPEVVNALENYFHYSTSTVCKYKTYYTDESWSQMIKDELNANRPLIYAGCSSQEGGGCHAWNCDGYQETDEGDLFHMNYGWGGTNNGYYAIDALYTSSLPGQEPNIFNEEHRVIKGIKPRASMTYPQGCIENRIITSEEGVIGDGSGNQNYDNNLTCKTIIQPECNLGSVSINFERFDLADGDRVTIYQGENTNAPVIVQFDSNNKPNFNDIYSSNNGSILIYFETNNTNTASGWDLSYKSKACQNKTITEKSGTITDGSGPCDYQPEINCRWCIKPENAKQIVLNFTDFELDSLNKDYIRIYKNMVSSENQVACFKNNAIPDSDIYIEAEKVYVKFKTNNDDAVAPGWTLTYDSYALKIKEDFIIPKNMIKVYPNPFINSAIVNIKNPSNEAVSIELTNITGQRIAYNQFEQTANVFTVELSDICKKEIESGVYILNVTIGNKKASYKLIAN